MRPIGTPTKHGVDTSEDVRNPIRLMEQWPRAGVLVVESDWRFPVAGSRLVFRDAQQWGDRPPTGAVLIGRAHGRDYWAINRENGGAGGYDAAPVGATGDGDGAASLREIGADLPDDEAVLATTALALLRWHAWAHYCARCGSPTTPVMGGRSRRCRHDHEEFPRVDSAAIVLVHDGDGRVVLARNAAWPARRFSVLAGFVEAGESLEDAVLREIGEEIGVAVDHVEYLGSQSWPFPRSLMLACAARAPRGAPLTPRDGEIAEARWFTRAQLQAVLDDDATQRPDAPVRLPGPLSIARRMIEAFAVGGP